LGLRRRHVRSNAEFSRRRHWIPSSPAEGSDHTSLQRTPDHQPFRNHGPGDKSAERIPTGVRSVNLSNKRSAGLSRLIIFFFSFSFLSLSRVHTDAATTTRDIFPLESTRSASRQNQKLIKECQGSIERTGKKRNRIPWHSQTRRSWVPVGRRDRLDQQFHTSIAAGRLMEMPSPTACKPHN
jgi:hypothetical protein